MGRVLQALMEYEVAGQNIFPYRPRRVLDEELRGATNYYGMTVGRNEVIDARGGVGSLAKCANHSCRPNCVVERWEVGGEICCGIFAKRSIEDEEEITIDYGGGNAATTVSGC
ncbi:putative SET domain-containing protein [Phytophthora cinnamomi]|uniref:putative SET domain-containing protein n=1 Tax=Phytophthora cinnamomi TaxID=4785 RepID=UPI00355AAA8D|nr:putative SET domain-containing protein [Phytophthora cinnamomi]